MWRYDSTDVLNRPLVHRLQKSICSNPFSLSLDLLPYWLRGSLYVLDYQLFAKHIIWKTLPLCFGLDCNTFNLITFHLSVILSLVVVVSRLETQSKKAKICECVTVRSLEACSSASALPQLCLGSASALPHLGLYVLWDSTSLCHFFNETILPHSKVLTS